MSEPITSSPSTLAKAHRIDPADLDLVATTPIDVTYLLTAPLEGTSPPK